MEVELRNSLTVKIRSLKEYKDYNIIDDRKERNLFAEVWNMIAFNIGIRAKLSDFELNEIFKFLSAYYKGYSLSDIREAFGLYSAQRLGFKDSHYQSLDNHFLGSVLSSYGDHRAKEENIKALQGMKEIEESKHEKYSTDLGKVAYDFIEGIFSKGQKPMIANWNFAFQFMEEHGMITYTNDEKEMFMDNVIEEFKAELSMLRTLKKDFSYEQSVLNRPPLLKMECRKKLINIYFENKSKKV